MKKRNILISIDWFEPAYKAGGPIRSIKNMLELLKDEFDFHILTSDRDLGDAEAFQHIPLDQWIDRKSYSVYFISKEKQNFGNLKKLLTEKQYDHYYFNSLFSIKFTLLPMMILKLAKQDHKVILATRGMLGKAALQIKGSKKSLFLKICKSFDLFKNIRWHASTDLEEIEIKEIFGEKASVHIAQNIAQKAAGNLHPEKVKTTRFVFLSRISSKKNLLSAISYFDQLDFASHKVEFHIYGPIEDKEYWNICQEMIKKIKTSVDIEYKGSLDREQLYSSLSKYHFMLFPTKNENFGHNIAEALICGLPVIISDQTPWKGLKDKKAGWDIPLEDSEQFKEAIKTAVGMSNEEYQEWRSAAMKFAEDRLFSEEVYESNRSLFD